AAALGPGGLGPPAPGDRGAGTGIPGAESLGPQHRALAGAPGALQGPAPAVVGGGTMSPWPMWYVFAVILAVLVAMASGRWRYDLIGMTGLLALAAVGILTPGQALAGFGHPAVITVAAVLVI